MKLQCRSCYGLYDDAESLRTHTCAHGAFRPPTLTDQLKAALVRIAALEAEVAELRATPNCHRSLLDDVRKYRI